MKTIYLVKVETNDKGWHSSDQLFTSAEEAMKHMRDYVAQTIMYYRRNGETIHNLKCWRESISGVDLPCGAITFQTTDQTGERWVYDYRVFAAYLWESNEEYRNGRWPWNM